MPESEKRRGRPPSPEKRGAVLAAAAKLFLEEGFDAVSVDRIAACAGVSKATVYKHFRDKAGLLSAIVEARCREYLDPPLSVDTLPDDCREALERLAVRFVEMVTEERTRALYRLVLSEAPRYPELARAFYDSGPRRALGGLARYLEEQVSRGRLVPMDPVRAAEQFFGMLSGPFHMRAMLGVGAAPSGAERQAHVRAAVESFLRAYGKAKTA